MPPVLGGRQRGDSPLLGLIEKRRRELPFFWWLSAEGWASARALKTERAAVLHAAEVLVAARFDGFLVEG